MHELTYTTEDPSVPDVPEESPTSVSEHRGGIHYCNPLPPAYTGFVCGDHKIDWESEEGRQTLEEVERSMRKAAEEIARRKEAVR